MKQEHLNEIKAIVILAFGMILLASLISFVPEDLPWYTSNPNVPVKNLIRIVGAYVAGTLFFTFGYSVYFLVLFLFSWSWNKFSSRDLKFTIYKFISFLVLCCVLSSLFALTGSQVASAKFQRAGIAGFLISDFLVRYLGVMGAYIVLLTLGAMALLLTGEFLMSPLFLRTLEGIRKLFHLTRDRVILPPKPSPVAFGAGYNARAEALKQKVLEESAATPKAPVKPKIRIMQPQPSEPATTTVHSQQPKMVGEYHLPTLDLLDDPPRVSADKLQGDLVSGAKMLEETLAGFGVSVRVADIERGPVITRYELEPAPGVKVQRITTLSNDIALAMQAQTVRIVAPIPGKNRVGIEVPNGASSDVYLKDVLAQGLTKGPKSILRLALGKDIAGKPIIADLAEMPHLLIAGTTGSGKTVCVNSIIMSMLFNASPNELKFLMVDPKMVELAPYNDIPHALCPAVTDAKKVSAGLNWVVGEMESRYSQLAKAGARNIKGFNAMGNEMPYIVVIIDELADLMQVSAKTIESAITRLAQLSRAVGIHLILATQRPSVDVITGVIKANFPARISFKVASKVDSRTVLDMNGAENLLGRGDMLFMKPGDAKPTRGQCSFVKDSEIQRTIEFIKDQQKPIYDDAILQKQTSSASGGSDEKDELYDEAVQLVIETNQASVSILQRRMRLGYTRAARLIDMMEQNGIVGPYCGSKPRDILVNREEWLLQNMKDKGGQNSNGG
jgi:S-DNA-T family DNA segregation ATPase FtsK/SpoIIIE